MKVSEVSFGAWAIGSSWGKVDDRESLAALHPDDPRTFAHLTRVDRQYLVGAQVATAKRHPAEQNAVVVGRQVKTVADPELRDDEAEFRRDLAADRLDLVCELAARGFVDEAEEAEAEFDLDVVDRERVELDPDREAPLQLGNEVRGLGQVEGARGDEEDVVGLDAAVLGADGRAFDQRQQVTLHALARYVGATEIPRVRGGLGVAIVSTPEGVMSGSEARKKNLGGELLAFVW